MINIILGTFFGDCAKGQCVNNLCDENTLVVRFSGANQVGHNVKHGTLEHCFRNFGSGTLKGCPTYWSEYCVCDLHTLLIEMTELKRMGITPEIIFSPFCELVTPYDVISQWNNTQNRMHGTVGTGFKQVLDRAKSGYSLTIADAKNLLILREKVHNIGRYYYNFVTDVPTINIDDWIVAVNRMAKMFPIKHLDYLNEYKNLVFEGSQGILLDQKHGVMPFCTPSNTTSKNAFEIIQKLNRKDTTIVNYVCRPYITRHGNGPLLTTTRIFTIDDENNQWNDFQKGLRACEFDVELLKHSLNIDYLYSEYAWHHLVFSHGDELSVDLVDRIRCDTDVKVFEIRAFEYEMWLDI